MLQGCLMIGSIVYERFVLDRSWKESIGKSSWQMLVASLIGIVVGLLIHPNGLAYLEFLWVQVVKVGVLTSWTAQFLRFRSLAVSRTNTLPYVHLAEQYFGVFTVPEMRTIGHALETSQCSDLLRYYTPASDESRKDCANR
jgi:hypothetical protein